MSTATRIRLFANGTEYDAWTVANCERCVLAHDRRLDGGYCVLERAIDAAACDDGTIEQAIAERLGWTVEKITWLGWPCPERLLPSELRAELGTRGSVPLDVALRRSGAAELPGLDGR